MSRSPTIMSEVDNAVSTLKMLVEYTGDYTIKAPLAGTITRLRKWRKQVEGKIQPRRKTRTPPNLLPRLERGVYDLLKAAAGKPLTAKAMATALRASDRRNSRVNEDTVRAAIKRLRDLRGIPISHTSGVGYSLEPGE